MTSPAGRFFAISVIALSVAACRDWRYQAGLANVPSINRPWTSEDFAHDVVANGDESCPRSGRAEDDPLRRRWPPCGGVSSSRWRPARPATPAPGPRRDRDILRDPE